MVSNENISISNGEKTQAPTQIKNLIHSEFLPHFLRFVRTFQAYKRLESTFDYLTELSAAKQPYKLTLNRKNCYRSVENDRNRCSA